MDNRPNEKFAAHDLEFGKPLDFSDEAEKHIVIYSHGFGVKKDGRGLFTDIAAALPDMDHVLFDYGQVDESKKTIHVAPLNEQAAMLSEAIAKAKEESPDAIVDLIAHSQGCVVAALANLTGVRKVVLLAPPPDLDVASRLEKYKERPSAVIDVNGTSTIPGTDGYTKVVPSSYWQSLKAPQPIKLYNSLNNKVGLLIIEALDDEIVEQLPADATTDSLRIEWVNADHNFTGEARAEVIKLIQQELAS